VNPTPDARVDDLLQGVGEAGEVPFRDRHPIQ
jgi:hypothetical protein